MGRITSENADTIERSVEPKGCKQIFKNKYYYKEKQARQPETQRYTDTRAHQGWRSAVGDKSLLRPLIRAMPWKPKETL